MKMNRRKILDIVLKQANEVFPDLGTVEINAYEHFVDFGASSIDRAVLVDSVIELLSLDLPFLDLIETSNICELVDMVYASYYANSRENID